MGFHIKTLPIQSCKMSWTTRISYIDLSYLLPTMLTPSRKARFLAQFEGSPVPLSPRRSPRKFKVGTPKRNAAQLKKKSPRKERKKVRWTEAPPQEFQLPQDLTPIPSPAIFDSPPLHQQKMISQTPNPIHPRPILPLPLRKPNINS